MSLQATTWQTVGPYFRIGLSPLFVSELASSSVEGPRIAVSGQVLDGAGEPVPDALLEIWQADARGRYAHPDDEQSETIDSGWSGFGRIPTGDDGSFRFTTINPGPVRGAGDALQAPHLLVGLMMRGLLRRLVTRIYFPGEPANESDEILQRVSPERRGTLLLKPVAEGQYLWDIHMQGKEETVFFEF
jgi:protocatechuate 3,4-dioxygenase alpha subunit